MYRTLDGILLDSREFHERYIATIIEGYYDQFTSPSDVKRM